MALPVTDDGSGSAGALGSPEYTNVRAYGSVTVDRDGSGLFKPSNAGTPAARRDDETFGNGQQVSLTIASTPTTTRRFYIWLNATYPSLDATGWTNQTAYEFRVRSDECRASKSVAGVFNDLEIDGTTGFANGDTFLARHDGSGRLEILKNGVATGVDVIDPSPLTGGRPVFGPDDDDAGGANTRVTSVTFDNYSPPSAPNQGPQEDPRRNRPGRGPYSLGKYFRPRIDAITQQAQTYNVSLAETMAGSDTVAAALEAIGALIEAANASDTPSSSATFPAAIAESGSLTDALAGLLAAVGSLSETGSSSDAVSAALEAIGALSESGSAADAPSSIATLVAALSEAGSAADSVDGSTTGTQYSVSLTEAGSAGDAPSSLLVAAGTITEAGSAAEAHSAQVVAVAVILEGVTGADSLEVFGSQLVQLAESGAAIDIVSSDGALGAGASVRLVVLSARSRVVTVH
jgi:hypothetical protein